MAKKPVTHEARRREVSKVASRILARGRIENLTVRDLASEAGYSTHVVSHYFDNKEDLLINTLRDCAARQVARLKAAIQSGADIAGCLEAMLPLDEERMIDCRVWMIFWPYALSDEPYKKVSNEFGLRWRHLMIGMLRLRGIIDFDTPHAERKLLGSRLQMVLAGVSVHGTLGVWSEEQQREILREQVQYIIASHRRTDEGIGQPPLDTVQDTCSRKGATKQELVQENNRLRKLLIEAMLSADQLKESSESNEMMV